MYSRKGKGEDDSLQCDMRPGSPTTIFRRLAYKLQNFLKAWVYNHPKQKQGHIVKNGDNEKRHSGFFLLCHLFCFSPLIVL